MLIEEHYILCSLCGKNVPEVNFNFHIKEMHSKRIDNKPNITAYDCDTCKKTFKSLSKLNYHKSIHQDRKFKCDYCDKRFLREDGKRIHMRSHTGEKPYKCDLCDKAFTQSNSLKTHMFLHTGKTIPCPICGKLFSRRSNLIVHNREHTGKV